MRVGPYRRLSAKELMLLNCSVGEDFWESLGLPGDQISKSWRKSTLNIHWKDWCWCWISGTLTSSNNRFLGSICEFLTSGYIYLANSLVLLMLLIWELYFENHWSKRTPQGVFSHLGFCMSYLSPLRSPLIRLQEDLLCKIYVVESPLGIDRGLPCIWK